MKIDSSLKPVGTSSTSAGRPAAGKAGARTEGSSSGTEVRISSASAQMAGASSGAPVDGARIAEIKLAISEGRFKVDANAVADGLLETARDLIQSQRNKA